VNEPPAKPTKKEVWDRLMWEAAEAEIDAAASVSVAEAEEYLAANGFDVAEERARAEAFLTALETGALDTYPDAGDAVEASDGEPPSEQMLAEQVARVEKARAARAVDAGAAGARSDASKDRRRSRPGAVWIAAAATVAVGGAAAAYVALHDGKREPERAVPEPSAPEPGPSDKQASPEMIAQAASLRQSAIEAMDQGKPDECVKLLDEARAKDPAGDAAAPVVELRARAKKALETGPK
jgi:hypothetical protein